MEDKEILRLFLSRTESAIAETAKKYGPYCDSVARRILSDPSDVEECVNDAYLCLWNSIPPKRPDCLRSYLGRIVRNNAISRLRERHTQRKYANEVSVSLQELEGCLSLGGVEDSVIDRVVIADLLNSFLAGLPRRDRVLFVRRYWYFCTVQELAEQEKMKPSAVKMSLLRSRKALRKLLEQEGVLHG